MIKDGTDHINEVNTATDTEDPFTMALVCITYDQVTDVYLQRKIITKNPEYKYQILGNYSHRIITFKDKVVLPNILWKEVFTWYHMTLQHKGEHRTTNTIIENFNSPGLKTYIKEQIRRCHIFKRYERTTKHYGTILIPDILYKPWEEVQVYWFGPWTLTDSTGVEHKVGGVSMIEPETCWIELHNHMIRQTMMIHQRHQKQYLLFSIENCCAGIQIISL